MSILLQISFDGGPTAESRQGTPGGMRDIFGTDQAAAMRRLLDFVLTLTITVSLLAVTEGAAMPMPASRTADDGARVVGESWLNAREADLSIASPALRRTGHVRLLFPAGWSRSARRSWPVLWLLHGGFDDHTSWTTRGDAARLTARSGAIVVMPDGGRCGWYSNWWNHGKGGPPRWETFHLTEVRQLLERGYHAGTRRAIAGQSMGGFGALAYAARHRGMFRAAASFSGTDDISYGPIPPVVVGINVIAGCGELDWGRIWGSPDTQRKIWRAHNPADLTWRLRRVRLYISSGSGMRGPYDSTYLPDPVEAATYLLSKSFAGRLADRGIPATVHFYQGRHSWPYWQRELAAALPLLIG
ncbi:MAG: diacylglycerol O-acyltransferase / trehalose O-mycolyltransferase [Streptosporangiaceae bacterium]|nr:diacylglycerol O-acyltransferase / trehalose O-mycolyltransferase [Streptosporangiaceae bacterium]